jgi:cadmium resistance protein CadD (predicted permease)
MIWLFLCALATLLAADAGASASAEAPPPEAPGLAGPGWNVAGRALAIAALLALSLAIALAAAPVPSGLIAYAGLLPLLRGSRQLLSVRFRPEGDPQVPASGHPVWFAFRAALSAGADLLVVSVAVFATHTGPEVLGLAAAMTLVALAAALARPVLDARPDRARAVAGVVRRCKPWTLVAAGAALLIEGGALNWLLLRR